MQYSIGATARVHAPADRVYSIIADYHQGRGSSRLSTKRN